MKDQLTATEAAKILSMNCAQVLYHCRTGKLLCEKSGKRCSYVIDGESVENFLKEKKKGIGMLVLSRKETEVIRISNDIEITVVEIRGHMVKLGIKAPKNVLVLREEVKDTNHGKRIKE